MPCIQPYRGDTSQMLLWKIASCIADGGGGGGVAGVTSFNLRTGVVALTSGDVTTALGFTPLNTTTGDARYVLKTGDTMTGALAIGNGVLVASTPYLNLSQTWNNGAVTFTGLQSNVTNTASSTNSNLFNFQVDGVDRFNFTPGGSLRAVRQDASDSGLNLFLRKRGNVGGATNAIANDATIGTVAYSGWDGAAFATGSRISGLGAEAWTGIAHGARIDLYTTPTGSTTEQLTLRVAAAGSVQFLNGTAALPALTFQSDPDTGIYRIGANSFGSSAGGSLILATSTTGINLTDALAYQYNAVNVIRAQTALNNYFFGPSGNLTMTGINNLSNGGGAFLSNTTGFRNVAIGPSALQANTTGSNNLAVGNNALLSNTTGSSNVALGGGALAFNTTGVNNVALGTNALNASSTGDSNLAIGVASLTSNTTGTNNVAIGESALSFNTTGIRNVAIGSLALSSSTTSSNNIAIGYFSLFDLTTATTGQNTAVGYNTGRGITTGINNTIVGANVSGLAAALSNNIILADGAGVIRLQIDSSGNTTLAGTVATAAGTAALPAKTFSADLDTGIYRVGANHLGVSTNGAIVLGVGAAALGFFATVAAAPVAQQVSGANLTNNVTAGGTDDTIANYTDLTIYANDAAAIRNDIYQLARKLKQVNDALRAYGLLT